ncbi:MAG: hypothetical protein R2699_15065 [Acidimicrobiales bacterium]
MTAVAVGPEAADADADGGRPLWWRHPVAWYEADGRRFLPGVLFPLAVFVVWRVAHLLLVHHFISAQGSPTPGPASARSRRTTTASGT